MIVDINSAPKRVDEDEDINLKRTAWIAECAKNQKAQATEVRLNIAIHEGLPHPKHWWNLDDAFTDDHDVEATTLWFNADVQAKYLLKAIETSYTGMTELFKSCFMWAPYYYRLIDDSEIVCKESKKQMFLTQLCANEWYAHVDSHLQDNLMILGESFDEPMMNDELINYLKLKLSYGI